MPQIDPFLDGRCDSVAEQGASEDEDGLSPKAPTPWLCSTIIFFIDSVFMKFKSSVIRYDISIELLLLLLPLPKEELLEEELLEEELLEEEPPSGVTTAGLAFKGL